MSKDFRRLKDINLVHFYFELRRNITNAFRRISLYFMTGFCIFGEEMVCLEIVVKTTQVYLLIALGMWECSSVIEHSTAD